MTPKEKAQELYNKFYISKISTNSFRKEESKNCALICADEVIETLPDTHYTEVLEHRPQYWEEVKTELSLL